MAILANPVPGGSQKIYNLTRLLNSAIQIHIEMDLPTEIEIQLQQIIQQIYKRHGSSAVIIIREFFYFW